MGNQVSLQAWVEDMLKVLDRDPRGFFCTCLHAIWKARNALVFEYKHIDLAELVELAKKNFVDYGLAISAATLGTTISSRENKGGNSSWLAPPNSLKINTDAALVANKMAGAGAVVRDSDGIILAAATWRIDSSVEPHEVEAQACFLGMQLEKDCCFLDIVLECDNSEVILARKNARVGDNYFGSCIADCFSLISSFRSVSFLHVKRERNRVPHTLANLALTSPNLLGKHS
ncbi:uncharacterized protein [Arachis hypogaea]|uniref:uncharacterized protein n=2 Tax=Arachis TaxID=3817 RepID=UPI003B2271B5